MHVPLSIPLEIAALAGLIAGLAVTIHAVSVLPNTIPIHFGLDGRANGWGNKNTMWQFIGIGAFLYLFLSVVRRFPHIFNYPFPITPENAAQQYRNACQMLDWLKMEMTWIFSYISWQIWQLAIAPGTGLGLIFLVITLVTTFGTIGTFIWRAFQAR
jgi:uncharacterized membrane protein